MWKYWQILHSLLLISMWKWNYTNGKLSVIAILCESEAKLNAVNSDIGEKVKLKFAAMAKNKEFNYLKEICKIIDWEVHQSFKTKLSAEEIAKLKFATIVSCELERSFSRFKHILSDRRLSFTMENLRMHLIINYNSNTV